MNKVLCSTNIAPDNSAGSSGAISIMTMRTCMTEQVTADQGRDRQSISRLCMAAGGLKQHNHLKLYNQIWQQCILQYIP